MLLIPYGIENRAVRRAPWVTMGLIFVNLVTHMVLAAVEPAQSNDVEILLSLVEKTVEERPYLGLPASLAARLGPEAVAQLDRQRQGTTSSVPVPEAGRLAREQKDFELLAEDLQRSLDRMTSRRFGFVPAEHRAWTILTSMFLHGGWLHLLGNMVFLFLAGAHVENVYGHWLYLPCYLVAGVCATLGHYLAGPGSTLPLVGASGAIAGVMGILLVRLCAARIRFLLLPFVIPVARIHLSLPAFVVLPFWLLEQFLGAREATGGGGVAWWAHIAGFLTGCVLAGLVSVARLEERWSDVTPTARLARLVGEIGEARRGGDFRRAHDGVREALALNPNDVGVWREALEVAFALGDRNETLRAVTRLLELLRWPEDSTETDGLIGDPRWAEVPELQARLSLAFAAFRERHGAFGEAIDRYDAVIAAAPGDLLALRALTRQAELLLRTGRHRDAREALARARAHAACQGPWIATVDRLQARLDGGA